MSGTLNEEATKALLEILKIIGNSAVSDNDSEESLNKK